VGLTEAAEEEAKVVATLSEIRPLSPRRPPYVSCKGVARNLWMDDLVLGHLHDFRYGSKVQGRPSTFETASMALRKRSVLWAFVYLPSITFQCPPLSGPIRVNFPVDLNSRVARSMVRSDFPSR